MKRFLFLLFFPLLTGGTTSVLVQIPCAECIPRINDTIIPDSIKDSIRVWAKEPVTRFKENKAKELDSLRGIYDSLAVEVKNVERESKKKLVYHTDTIKGLLMEGKEPVIVNGRVVQKIDVWFTYYWRFPDGERRYFDYKIKRIQ